MGWPHVSGREQDVLRDVNQLPCCNNSCTSYPVNSFHAIFAHSSRFHVIHHQLWTRRDEQRVQGSIVSVSPRAGVP